MRSFRVAMAAILIGTGAVLGVAPAAASGSGASTTVATGAAVAPAHARTAAVAQPLALAWAPDSAGHRPVAPNQPAPDPAEVVEAYFRAINNGEYVAAWALGGKNITGRPYDYFVRTFSDTARDDVTVRSVVGNNVEVELDATQTDGSHRFFAGTYTVRDGVIVAARIHRE
ncbi:hypothetical protein TPA0598_03_03960 [Streptomyces lydicamycinicus]|uniref:SnoaL-like domain-containing protein n=2 Tax=Streptomyces lydicamycinicus TaxID=1546107 RepID=A0A0P4R4X3_9ACTN|nr:hypothetical protein TPA0598_03_03960 [Streptomyces lydicamycinicus]